MARLSAALAIVATLGGAAASPAFPAGGRRLHQFPPAPAAYSNPYCTACRIVFSGLNEKADATVEQLCEYVPENKLEQCYALARVMRANRDVTTLVKNGCLDKTRELTFVERNATYADPLNDPRLRAGGQCPAVIACNIIQAASGGPMCGQRIRQWGDFLIQDSLQRPVPPSPFDTYPQDGAPMATPLPWYSKFFGDPYCDICIDVTIALGKSKDSPPEAVCMTMPFSMKQMCEEQVRVLKKNADFRSVILDGCVDRTALAPMEKAAGKCSGEVGCNIVHATWRGGPYCGAVLRQWGDFPAGADSADRERRDILLGGGPLMLQ